MRFVATIGAMLVAAAIVGANGPVLPLGIDRYRPVPVGNPLTREKVDLGRRLFHERALSRDGRTSCATCHDPRRSFADGRVVAVGAGGASGRRNAPALLNRAWGTTFFWDGRATTLEQQVLSPLVNPLELGSSQAAAAQVIRSRAYEGRFRRAFGREPTIEDLARALASYVRTIVTGDAPFDQYGAGDVAALSASAIRGRRVFEQKAACTGCHSGPFFTDEVFHNTGVAWRRSGSESVAGGATADGPKDIGRAGITGDPGDRGAFKTPTLRNVALTAPYMHDGSLATLAEVIDFYNAGGQPNPALDHRMRPLHLTDRDRNDLLAFLGALTGPVWEGW